MRRVLSASAALIFVLLPGLGSASGGNLQVVVEGAVHRPGPQQLSAGSRFADAALAAQPRRDAYLLGASVFRVEAQREQLRLRAGLLHDLGEVAASTDVPPAVAARAQQLRAWVERLPATGRLPMEGDARRLEATKGDRNRLITSGDRLYYPERPRTISVVGAVHAPCAAAHVPGQDASGYLAACAVDKAAAEPDTIQVIQPDGRIHVLGVAAWNRSPPLALAPGAIIYIPLRTRSTRKLAPELEDAMGAFLATQPLPHDGLMRP